MLRARASARLAARLLALAAGLAAGPVWAHPHVWIAAKSEIVFGPDGKLAAIRHAWTFDDAYSAFAVEGVERQDGRIAPAALAELARTNIESLAEYRYFTNLKAGGVRQALGAPRNESLSFEDGKLTLRFELPLKTPASPGRAAMLDVYDPTFFVDFESATAADAVSTAGAPAGCVVTFTRPKPLPVSADQTLSEEFFKTLSASSGYGQQFSSRALLVCP